MLFSNEAFNSFIKNEPYQSFINPTFDQFLTLENSTNLIFDGFLTLGDYNSVNTSIEAQIYRKQNKLLLIGGINTTQLLEQNVTLHQLNREISNLQRDLIKNTHTLENTLSQLNAVNLDLNKLNTEKDKFFSIIAHDLKSPFNNIMGLSEILIENIHGKDYNEIEKYAEMILFSSHKAVSLLMNLMEWSQTQTGRMIFNPKPMEIYSVINEAILLHTETAKQKSISISVAQNYQIRVLADKAMISTVLRNLISNAIKFTNPGGNIIISTAVNQKEVIICVKDSGVGLEKTTIEKLFRIDVNHSTPGTQNEKGTGLGLILCKEFVEKHDGKIWVESNEGKGSTFFFTIPYLAETEEKEQLPAFAEEKIHKPGKLKILVVEDDETSRMLLKAQIKPFASDFFQAITGHEAVESCRKNPDIDLILMDINLPGMDGYVATRQIREFNKEVVIIAQTAFAQTGDREKAIEAGCNDYISKPINRSDLIVLINQYLS